MCLVCLPNDGELLGAWVLQIGLGLDPDNVFPLHSEKQEVDQEQSESEEPEGTDDRNDVSSHEEEMQHSTSTMWNAFGSPKRLRQKRRQRAHEMDDAHKKISQTFETPKQCDGV